MGCLAPDAITQSQLFIGGPTAARGIAPIHTPFDALAKLPDNIKRFAIAAVPRRRADVFTGHEEEGMNDRSIRVVHCNLSSTFPRPFLDLSSS